MGRSRFVARRCDFFSYLPPLVFHSTRGRSLFFFYSFLFSGGGKVKYFSPMTNLCIVRVARGTATNKTWAALVLLDTVGGGNGGSGGGAGGHKVVPHVIHISGASLSPALVSLGC